MKIYILEILLIIRNFGLYWSLSMQDKIYKLYYSRENWENPLVIMKK